MTRLRVAATFAAAIAVLLTACGGSNTASMDDGLKQDLAKVSGSSMELAPRSANGQVVVSAIEGGLTSTPTRASSHKAAAPRQTLRSVQQPTRSVAQTPSPAPMASSPAPTQVSPAEPPPLPPVQAPVARQQTNGRTGPYKTEAEIFRQMPWIRP